MSMHRMAVLPACLLLLAVLANAATKSTMRITVLDSETRSLNLGGNGVPNNCEQVTFDAYCRSSATPRLRITLLVQEGNQPPFRVSCSVDTRFSRCIPLPKGETFDARPAKKGIIVYYSDDKGKVRSQLYTLVAGNIPAETAATPPSTAAQATAGKPAPAAAAPAATPASAAPAAAPAPATDQQAPASAAVKCAFSSTPSGAEISIDGKYVGSTPSEIAVSPGGHTVTFTLPGFAEWKRDLSVAAGSGVVNVAATLQKAP